jgi:hypothetical protein
VTGSTVSAVRTDKPAGNSLVPGGQGAAPRAGSQDVGFAAAILFMLTVLFLPLPAVVIDMGLALSISLSVLILMVALWIQKPLDFSAFPTVLLIATLLRLSLNIATTRLILSNGAEGYAAAGHVIEGFANFVMSGDFVIGVIVFLILITVNFPRHHQGRDPHRGSGRAVHAGRDSRQADGHRRGSGQRLHRREDGGRAPPRA